MSSILRILPSTTFGTLTRWLSNGRLCQFPDDKCGFLVHSSGYPMTASHQEQALEQDQEKSPNKDDQSFCQSGLSIPTPNARNSETSSHENLLVSWYGPEDQENPHFWPLSIKLLVYFQINFYTFIVYMASSVFSVAEPELMEVYGVSIAVSSLGLALVLLGYGVGALLFSPLSEIPSIGRNPPYVISLALFTLVSGIAVAVNNAPGFLVLRFLQGFFGSPCLATGAASLTDITDAIYIPYGLWIWGLCAVAAPAVAPCIAGFSTTANGWKWSMWEILWGSAPCLVLLVCFFTISTILSFSRELCHSSFFPKHLFPPSCTSAPRGYGS